jgi:predicted amidohydrolase
VFIVAAAQLKTSDNKDENINKVIRQIDIAAEEGATLVAFPETSISSHKLDNNARFREAEPLDGPLLRTITEKARASKIYVAFGFIEKAGTEIYNSVALVSGNGILTTYRKLHLFDAFSFKESERYKPGSTLPEVVEIPGLGRTSIITCYDLRFPELARILALRGCQLLLVPTAWEMGTLKEEHWQILLKARAMENCMYVIGPAQVGNRFCGRSMIVDPMGVVLRDAGEIEGVITAKVDESRIKHALDVLGPIRNRRPDIYRIESVS